MSNPIKLKISNFADETFVAVLYRELEDKNEKSWSRMINIKNKQFYGINMKHMDFTHDIRASDIVIRPEICDEDFNTFILYIFDGRQGYKINEMDIHTNTIDIGIEYYFIED